MQNSDLLSPFSLLSLVIFQAVAGCGGTATSPDETPVLYQFRLYGHPATEDFLAVISDPTTKALARSQLALPEAQRFLHVQGMVANGNDGYNLAWNWHFSGSVTLVQVSIEACDTTPTQIEANVSYWETAPGGACPWTSYVYAELP
jgi:hypothetical protein